MKNLRSGFAAVLLCSAAVQLVRPDCRNPPVNPARSLWNGPKVDPRVAFILRRACANCHSYETDWPWYARISPVSWMIARHVNKGRAKLNFSEWSAPSMNQLEEIGDAIDQKEMPPANYVLMHREAQLSEGDRQMLMAWTLGKISQIR